MPTWLWAGAAIFWTVKSTSNRYPNDSYGWIFTGVITLVALAITGLGLRLYPRTR
jgi:cytochrome bd-type quinol oxidase subunit 2